MQAHITRAGTARGATNAEAGKQLIETCTAPQAEHHTKSTVRGIWASCGHVTLGCTAHLHIVYSSVSTSYSLSLRFSSQPIHHLKSSARAFQAVVIVTLLYGDTELLELFLPETINY